MGINKNFFRFNKEFWNAPISDALFSPLSTFGDSNLFTKKPTSNPFPLPVLDKLIYNSRNALDTQNLSKINSDAANGQAIYNAQQATLHSAHQAQINRDFQAQQAQINRDWQERMSNTAYQRAVKDLKAAGLNPILRYTNLSARSTPSGSTPSGSAGSAYKADTFMTPTSQLGLMYSDVFHGLAELFELGGTSLDALLKETTAYMKGKK